MATKPKKLPSGNWRCQVYLGKTPDGKPVRRSFTASTRKEAQRLAAEAEAAHREDHPADERDMTLGTALDTFIALKTPVLSPSTIKAYRSVRRNSLKNIIDYRLRELTPAVIQQEISREAETKSPKTVRNIHGLLTAVLRLYQPELQLTTRLPQKKKLELVIPTLEDIRALVDAADQKGDMDLALAIILGSQLGLRRSEICALTLGDFDLPGGTVYIGKAMVEDSNHQWVIKAPKTSAGYRTLPITEDVRHRVGSIIGPSNRRLVSINPGCLSQRFETLRETVDVIPFRFHDLRHYNASVMISLNVPAMYITRRMGHSSDEMVKRVYGHIMDSKMEEINNRITEHFKQP